MIKRYYKTFLKTFFFTTLTVIFLNMYIAARFTALPYARVTISTLIMSLFTALAISVFKSEKGNGYINAILGYILIMPALLTVRQTYGNYLFRLSYTLYIVMAVIGIIYGIALLVASKKYKSEVDDLNRLLLKKENQDIEEEEE